MSIKDQFESHPVVWGLTLIVAGFVAGFGARGYLPREAIQTPISNNNGCRVEGLAGVEEAHNERISTLQKQLMVLEAKASDHALITSYQDTYKQSADRVRHDIEIENAMYQSTIQSLVSRCR